MTDTENTAPDTSAPPMPPYQDAGQTPTDALNPDLQTNPPNVALPLTGSTGQGFNAPDAGTGLMPAADLNAPRPSAPAVRAMPDDAQTPPVGSIDRDALDGERAPAGSQANAEAVASTGPV